MKEKILGILIILTSFGFGVFLWLYVGAVTATDVSHYRTSTYGKKYGEDTNKPGWKPKIDDLLQEISVLEEDNSRLMMKLKKYEEKK